MKKYIFLLALPLLATDWPQWRGVERTGISKETGLLQSWPKDGPPLVWKTQGLGEGYSAFSISGGLLFTQGQRGDQEFVLAFESDEPKDFLDLVMELRESKASAYTLKDTPTFTGIRHDLAELLDLLPR